MDNDITFGSFMDLVIGEKEENFMKKMKRKKQDHDLPIGHLTKVADFLPPPESLLIPEETTKITLSLDKRSLQFFKDQAEKLGTKYQKMIREVVRGYVEHYS